MIPSAFLFVFTMDMSMYVTFALQQVATRGSILFFTVLSLYNLDQMYTFSSQWFMEVFTKCIQSILSPPDDQEFDLYSDEIVEYLTISVFQRVTSGILTKHFLPFAFKLCTMLLLHKDPSLNSSTIITHHEWMALLKNTSLLEADASSTSSPFSHGKKRRLKPEEIPADVWETAMSLAKTLPAFQGLLVHIVNNVKLWVQFSQAPYPWNFIYEGEEIINKREATKRKHSTPIGGPFMLDKINRFQRLLLINAFCPEQFAATVKWFVDSEMGVVYTTKIPCNLNTAHQQMTNTKPVLIIITPSECKEICSTNYIVNIL